MNAMTGYKLLVFEHALLVLVVIMLFWLMFITILVQGGRFNKLDRKMLDWFSRHQTRGLDRFFAAWTWLGSLWVLVPALVVVVLALSNYGYYVQSGLFGFGFFGAVITTYIIKYLLNRKRPVHDCTTGKMPPDPAFPSAHTTQIFSFAIMLWLVQHNLGFGGEYLIIWLFIAVASGVAVSRLYLLVHFPSDVLAGIIVAILWGWSILYFVKLGFF